VALVIAPPTLAYPPSFACCSPFAFFLTPLQTFWADGARWWPALVLSVSVADKQCALYYETGQLPASLLV
jgi:hypothetical protein